MPLLRVFKEDSDDNEAFDASACLSADNHNQPNTEPTRQRHGWWEGRQWAGWHAVYRHVIYTGRQVVVRYSATHRAEGIQPCVGKDRHGRQQAFPFSLEAAGSFSSSRMSQPEEPPSGDRPAQPDHQSGRGSHPQAFNRIAKGVRLQSFSPSGRQEGFLSLGRGKQNANHVNRYSHARRTQPAAMQVRLVVYFENDRFSFNFAFSL